MGTSHQKTKSKSPMTNFIGRVSRLSQKKKLFLLDIMEQTRETCKKIKKNPLYQRYPSIYHPWEKDGIFKRQEREFNLALQMGSIAIWMLLDDPKKRTTDQIDLRLREVDRLVMFHAFHNVYTAFTAQIDGTIFDETHIPSGEAIPKEKQQEYENRIKEYIFHNPKRQKLIESIHYSKTRYNFTSISQLNHQRED